MKKILIDGVKYEIAKYYSDFIWRLKSERGEIINIFYSQETKHTVL